MSFDLCKGRVFTLSALFLVKDHIQPPKKRENAPGVQRFKMFLAAVHFLHFRVSRIVRFKRRGKYSKKCDADSAISPGLSSGKGKGNPPKPGLNMRAGYAILTTLFG